jgi:hypothetical protein
MAVPDPLASTHPNQEKVRIRTVALLKLSDGEVLDRQFDS